MKEIIAAVRQALPAAAAHRPGAVLEHVLGALRQADAKVLNCPKKSGLKFLRASRRTSKKDAPAFTLELRARSPNGHCGRYRDRPLATIPIRMPTPNATAIATSGRCSVSLEILLRAAVPYRVASLPKAADCSLSELVPWRKRSAQLDKADATASPRPSAVSRAFDEARVPSFSMPF